jgi:hypothetical protein
MPRADASRRCLEFGLDNRLDTGPFFSPSLLLLRALLAGGITSNNRGNALVWPNRWQCTLFTHAWLNPLPALPWTCRSGPSAWSNCAPTVYNCSNYCTPSSTIRLNR